MNQFIPSWIFARTRVRFTSTARHEMDELVWSAAGSSSRFTRNSLETLVVYSSDDEPPEMPEAPTLPTPTDVPVPEPFDVPVPEPMDVPPPEPSDLPPPKPRPVP
jgi:outer membrane biosynthesis protein TonB